jgi:hypothetical protein
MDTDGARLPPAVFMGSGLRRNDGGGIHGQGARQVAAGGVRGFRPSPE